MGQALLPGRPKQTFNLNNLQLNEYIVRVMTAAITVARGLRGGKDWLVGRALRPHDKIYSLSI